MALSICGIACEKQPAVSSPQTSSSPPLSSAAKPSPPAKPSRLHAEVSSKVIKQISELLGKPESSISPDKDLFRDLGADSLDAVELIMALEETFNIEIKDSDAEKIRKVSDLVDCIVRIKETPPVTGVTFPPGFYNSEDPKWSELQSFLRKRDLKVNLAGHNGISFRGEHDLTIENLRQRLAAAPGKKEMAVIFLEKNFTDMPLLSRVREVLKGVGFKITAVERAHSQGCFFDLYDDSGVNLADPSPASLVSEKHP
jgi:acyl carrier protein